MPVVIKTVDEVLTSDTTLQDDNQLFFTVGANESWAFEAVLIYNAHATPDIKIKWDAPSGSTMTWADQSITDDDSVFILSTTTTISGNGANRIAVFRGVLLTGGSAGTFKLTWAQNTSSINASTMLIGSYIVGHEIAGATLSGGSLIKTRDETIQSLTTYQSDDELHFFVPANRNVAFTIHILWNSGTTPDMKFKLFGPSGSTILWSKRNTGNDYNDQDDEIIEAGAGAVKLRALIGIILNGSTPGDFFLKWAQNTSDASDTKVLVGSALIHHAP